MRTVLAILLVLLITACTLSAAPSRIGAEPELVAVTPTAEPAEEPCFTTASLAGTWVGHNIGVAGDGSSASTQYGTAVFDASGNASVTVTAMDGTTSTQTFTCTVDSDGQLMDGEQLLGVMSYDEDTIILYQAQPDQSTIAVFSRVDGDDYSLEDITSTWRVHSLQTGADWKGWGLAAGTLGSSGEFTGTLTTSDGGPFPYTAGVGVASDGTLTMDEPGQTLPQHGRLFTDGLMFTHVYGSVSTPGVGRLALGIRTGGSFVTEDLKGEWWFCGLGTYGDSFGGRMICQSDGTFAGQRYDNGASEPVTVTGTMGLTPAGNLSIDILPGSQGTLSLGRDLFVFTWAEDTGHAFMIGTKHPLDAQVQADVTHIYMNWGNGYQFDDPLVSDTEGTFCGTPGIPGLLVNPAYFLPGTDGSSAAIAGSPDTEASSPVFADGKLVFTADLPMGAEDAGCQALPEISFAGSAWPAATQDVELRATFENIRGDLVPTIGDGMSASVIGFAVLDGDRYMGEVYLGFGHVSALLDRGVSNIPAGIYNRAPIFEFQAEAECSPGNFVVSPAEGYDPTQPVELKLLVSQWGWTRAYARFGTGDWISVGEVSMDFWPGQNAKAAGCYPEGATQGTLWYAPFIGQKLEYIEPTEDPELPDIQLPKGAVGMDYETRIEVIEQDAPPYTYSIVGGELPPNLELYDDGTICGTPSEAGTYAFTVHVEDSQYPPASDDREYTIEVVTPVYGIQEAKSSPDGVYCLLEDVQVTARTGGGYYVENTDRSSGIKIMPRDGTVLFEGNVVAVFGKLCTDFNGERVVEVEAQEAYDQAGPLRPLGIGNRDLGGSDFACGEPGTSVGQRGVSQGTGLNNIGLLVGMINRVTQIDPGGQYFYADNGWGGWRRHPDQRR